MDKPIARVRQDRNWRELERIAPIEPTWKSWASALGCILFMAVVWAVL